MEVEARALTTFRGLIQLIYSRLPPEAEAAEWRRRVLNIRELFKSQLLAPQKQSVASADSMEKMNLRSMDFPVSHGRCSRGEGEMRNGNSKACGGVFPSLPVQKLH